MKAITCAFCTSTTQYSDTPNSSFTRTQALPGDADQEALPPILLVTSAIEARTLDIGSQTEPGSQLDLSSKVRRSAPYKALTALLIYGMKG